MKEWLSSVSIWANCVMSAGFEAGFNAYDIAKLMGHANISTSQHYVRNLVVGAGEAVMLKNQQRHNTVASEDSGTLRVAVNS
jgi:hypothetical protein